MEPLLVTNQEQTNQGTAESRESRVAELRQQYQAGTYRVEAEKLSAKIIDAHRKPSRAREQAQPSFST